MAQCKRETQQQRVWQDRRSFLRLSMFFACKRKYGTWSHNTEPLRTTVSDCCHLNFKAWYQMKCCPTWQFTLEQATVIFIPNQKWKQNDYCCKPGQWKALTFFSKQFHTRNRSFKCWPESSEEFVSGNRTGSAVCDVTVAPLPIVLTKQRHNANKHTSSLAAAISPDMVLYSCVDKQHTAPITPKEHTNKAKGARHLFLHHREHPHILAWLLA